jgi:hypothetical protein
MGVWQIQLADNWITRSGQSSGCVPKKILIAPLTFILSPGGREDGVRRVRLHLFFQAISGTLH